MSTGVTISTWKLRQSLNTIVPLFPSGSHVIPVLFKLSENTLQIVCTTGCVFSDSLTVSNLDNESWEITIMYRNLLEILPKEGQSVIKHEPYGLEIKADHCSVQLPVGYSIITPPATHTEVFKEIPSHNYSAGLSTLVGMGLSALYSQDKPVHMYGSVALLKYPNIQVQARTPGLDITALLAPEHVKMLIRFEPTGWYTNNVDVLVLKRDSAFLELPMEPVREENNFVKLLSGMSEPVTVDLEHYLDKLRSLSKTNPRGRCKLVIYEDGLVTSVNQDNICVDTSLGTAEGKVLSSVYIPMPVWMAMVRAAGSSKAQILQKGDVICLRTQSVVMVTRALV